MFKNKKNIKNSLNSNSLIMKGMYKRRRLASLAISALSDNVKHLQVVK